MPNRPSLFSALLLVIILATLSASAVELASAQEGWVIRSFDTSFLVRPDGVVEVTEDIQVDFQSLTDRHGIFRDIPVEYRVDPRHNRHVTLSDIKVDDGRNPHKFTTTRIGAYLQLKIGDADVIVRGQQHYRITYKAAGVLTSQEGHDELYWNATGNNWGVPILRASARVNVPHERGTCFQGIAESRTPCRHTTPSDVTQQFDAVGALNPGEGLTFVVAIPKGTVTVPPPDIVYVRTAWEDVKYFLGLRPLPLGLMALLGFGIFFVILRHWWEAGRDRWYGDVQYLTGSDRERTRPMFAKETTVVEYTPPELERRRLRPAEIGLLLDERADTLDVSATIVDLAVRGYLKIEEEKEKTWVFSNTDYKLIKLKEPDESLLEYEALLLKSLFEDGEEVEMSDLKNKFYDDLAKVKESLDKQGTERNKFFAKKPSSVRLLYVWVGIGAIVLGTISFFFLLGLGAGIVALPIVLGGLLVLFLAGAMPRRTASGRETYRRSLGFREYMVTAETDRQRFNEQANIFAEYLPYAIVMGVTAKWAKAFEGMESVPQTTSSWYSGSTPFHAAAFAGAVTSFSSSMGSAISSTPPSSGGSGFSGGSSGGGFGGGGGGSW